MQTVVKNDNFLLGAMHERPKVLVAEDEESIGVMIYETLSAQGFDSHIARDGQAALREFFAWKPDVVVLDVMMPQMDGWTVLNRIREVAPTPVIMLTALGQEDYAVKGLRGGADDYMVKPLRLKEFVARIEAAMRKRTDDGERSPVYEDLILRVDPLRHEVYLRGEPVSLSALEFRLLSTLVQHGGVVLSPDRLLRLCWPDGYGSVENVRVYIGYLRKKLDDANSQMIETVREFGYRYRVPQPEQLTA